MHIKEHDMTYFIKKVNVDKKKSCSNTWFLNGNSH